MNMLTTVIIMFAFAWGILSPLATFISYLQISAHLRDGIEVPPWYIISWLGCWIVVGIHLIN